jgi:hypothetical protein
MKASTRRKMRAASSSVPDLKRRAAPAAVYRVECGEQLGVTSCAAHVAQY